MLLNVLGVLSDFNMDNFPYKDNQDLFETKDMHDKLTDICFCEEMQDPEVYICPNCTELLKQNIPKDDGIRAYIYMKKKNIQKNVDFIFYLAVGLSATICLISLFIQIKIVALAHSMLPNITERFAIIAGSPVAYFFLILAILYTFLSLCKPISHILWTMNNFSWFFRLFYSLMKYAIAIIPVYFWVIPTNCVYFFYNEIAFKHGEIIPRYLSMSDARTWMWANYPVQTAYLIHLLNIILFCEVAFIIFMDILIVLLRHKINVYNKEIAEMVEEYYKDDRYVRFD